MKFKIDIIVDGDPGVSQTFTGTAKELEFTMTARSYSSVQKWFAVFRNKKVTGMALKYDSVNYLICKAS